MRTHPCDLVALHAISDLSGPRRDPGRRPWISNAELVCLAVTQILLDCPSGRRWLRGVHARVNRLFGCLP